VVKFGVFLDGVLDFGYEEQKDGSEWSRELRSKSIEELDQEVKERTPDNQLELQEKTCQFIAQQVRRIEPELILDVATGRGMLLEKLAPITESSSQLVCVDLSPAVLKEVRKKTKNTNPRAKINYIACNAAALPFNDNCFDMAVSFFGVANMGASIVEGISEARRVLKPDGSFLNASLIIEQGSESYRLLGEYYGERAGRLIDFVLSSGFRESHKLAGFLDVRLEIIGESVAQKNKYDLLPVEGDWFASGVAVAQQRNIPPENLIIQYPQTFLRISGH